MFFCFWAIQNFFLEKSTSPTFPLYLSLTTIHHTASQTAPAIGSVLAPAQISASASVSALLAKLISSSSASSRSLQSFTPQGPIAYIAWLTKAYVTSYYQHYKCSSVGSKGSNAMQGEARLQLCWELALPLLV